ncbi:MAG: outer membrane lipoprotein carrier protein LolA [Alphaproteobacteria bacterium]|nr:outer membrane lipoprotein carrier protein LolA [Alphaproteobacteria bacterium]
MRSVLMFGVCLLGASVAFAFAAPAACAQEEALPPLEEQTVEEDQSLAALRQVQTYMDEVTSLKADFIQRAPNGNVASGRLFLERPGYVRFDYTDETPFLIVADGKTLNFVDYEIGQVSRWPLKKTPLRALLGSSIDLASLQARIQVDARGLKGLITLTAKDPENPEQGQIELFFMPSADPSGLTLIGWEVIDAKGELTVIELSNQQVNTTLEEALWSFEDPRGLTKRRRTRR